MTHKPAVPRFRCVVVGEGTLPLHCANVLIDRGHEVVAIATGNAASFAAASKRGIKLIDTSLLSNMLANGDIDFLFSVVNGIVLAPAVLSLVVGCAINYHDAPLPLYAGMNATTWAIMAGGKTHGITWHELVERIDAGPILLQRTIRICEHETAFTLNVKCYEAAGRSFVELVGRLESCDFRARPQDLSRRSYFGRYKRPENAGVICWDQPSAAIYAFVRSLDFGVQPNPLVSPKLFVGEDFFICRAVRTLCKSSASPAGTLIKIGADGIVVATRDGALEIQNIHTLDGDEVAAGALPDLSALGEGGRLPRLSPALSERIEALAAETCRHEDYWLSRLVELSVPNLPHIEAQRMPAKTSARGGLPIELPASFSQSLGCTDPAAALVALFGVYLARVGNAEPFDIGMEIVADWTAEPKLRALFATQVPLRLSLDLSQSVLTIAGDVRRQLDDLASHSTFARDVFQRQPRLSVVRAAGWQHGLPVSVIIVDGLSGDELHSCAGLTLMIQSEGKAAKLVFDPTVVPDLVARRIATDLQRLAGEVAVTPAAASQKLQLLSPSERHRLLVEWNRTSEEYPKDSTLHELFEVQVHKTPDKVALVCADAQLSYSQLNERANRLAHHLRELGVDRDTLVGICIERSLDMVVGILGILKSGGAYVPLDPAYPKKRLTYMLDDTKLPLLVTQQRFLDKLPEHAAHVVCLDSYKPQRSKRSADNPTRRNQPQDLAYVIYTSGSTGTPKGVMIEHRSVVNYLHHISSAYEVQAGDRILQFASLSFDASVRDIFLPLLNGATLFLRPAHMIDSPARFLEMCKEWKLTYLPVPTAYWHELTTAIDKQGLTIPDSIRLVSFGGESVSARSVATWQRLVNAVKIRNGYGPTEATIAAIFYEIPLRADAADEHRVAIGRPVANVQAYILDSQMQPVPIGVGGELYIGGNGLARGYLNRPDLTAERFIASPFSDLPNDRLYRTGDLARYRADGNIEFLGRTDRQVKIRGFRIEPGEIEAVLRRHPCVRDTVVMVPENTGCIENLVAYIVADGAHTVTQLRSFLRQQLPDYMIPSSFVSLDAIPLDVNGKIDFAALPAPVDARPSLDPALRPARTPSEKLVASIWAELLELEEVGVDDDFFDLGGHSLLLTRVASRLRESLGFEISLLELFERSTVANLAKLIESAEAAGTVRLAPLPRISALARRRHAADFSDA